MKKYTVSILGCGSRGCEAYGYLMQKQEDKFQIVALCDNNPVKLQKYGERFQIDEAHRFSTDVEFFKEKRSDVLLITTLDKDHVRQCIRALELGYDILLEKPISDRMDECQALLRAQRTYGGKVIVCHVLRYAPAYVKIKELLDSGVIGQIVTVDATENVHYSHIAHSYVRGNWRRTEDTTPMILAKCCHDLDYLQYFIGARCESISSVGDLMFFKKEHQPEGAADRCLDCPYVDSCVWSAKVLYVDRWKYGGSRPNVWPFNIITTASPLTEEALMKAIKEGPYGRCVFACDNDAVDHQLVQMTFENGVKAHLSMLGLTGHGGREIRFTGTKGEIHYSEYDNFIRVQEFSYKGTTETIDVDALVEQGFGHGGGDSRLVDAFYSYLSNGDAATSTLEASVESHLMGICAEESRLKGGVLIKIPHDVQ